MQWSGSGADFISLEIEWYCLPSLLLCICCINDCFLCLLFFVSLCGWQVSGFLLLYYYFSLFFCCHSLLQARDAFFLGGRQEVKDFCFDGSEKIVLLFVIFYLLFVVEVF